MRVFLDLMWYFRAHKWRYMGGISILVLVAVLGLIPPQIVGRVVDAITRHTLTRGLLVRWVLYIFIIAVVVYVLRFFWRVLLFGAAIELSTLLRRQLYAHFSIMSPHFFQGRRIGDLMAHSTNDIQAIEATGTDGILTLVDSITTGTTVILTMVLTLNWKLTIIALVPLPFMAWATSFYGSLMHKSFHLAQAAFADLNDKVQENFSGVRVVKSFGQEEPEIKSFRNLSQYVVDKNIAVAKIDALFDPTIGVVVAFSYLLTIAFGSVFVVHRTMTLGNLTTFTMYLGQLVWPMMAFGWLFNIVERGHASYDRVRALLAIKPDIVDKPGAVNRIPSGDMEFSIPHFKYPESQEDALTDISIRLPQGRTLGIVGKTGSGKSTLVKLLMREYDLEEGNIRIGSQSIYDTTLDALRQAVAYVPEDHFLFSTSIAENIAFGKPAADRKEVEWAARLAVVDEDIATLTEGYATVVGERGVTLSGGQKQRVSIARALLLDAEILILDDCLSAVDARTEARILENLRRERKDRTTVIIAHRMSAVEQADIIVVVDDGRIVESGTHEELLSHDGWYRKTYRQQQLESMIEEGGA